MLLDADLREARFVEERWAGELDTAAVFLRLEARLFVALLAVVLAVVLFLLEAAFLVAVFLVAAFFVAGFLFGADLRLVADLPLADFLLADFLAVDFLEVVRFTDFLLVARFFVEDADDLRRWLNMACLLLIYCAIAYSNYRQTIRETLAKK